MRKPFLRGAANRTPLPGHPSVTSLNLLHFLDYPPRPGIKRRRAKQNQGTEFPRMRFDLRGISQAKSLLAPPYSLYQGRKRA